MIIRASIDVTKLDKTEFRRTDKGAVYASIALIERKDGEDKYGNHFMVVQDLSKERRLAGDRGAILGSAKFVVRDSQQGGGKPQPTRQQLDNQDHDLGW